MNINTIEYKDGIAFYQNEKELAFYSNITGKIVYNINTNRNFNCIEIPYGVNLYIINFIADYIDKIAANGLNKY